MVCRLLCERCCTKVFCTVWYKIVTTAWGFLVSGRGKCLVCASEHRAAIEIGAVAGVSIRVLADRFNIGRSSVAAHVRNHLTQQQRAAILSARKPSPIDPDQLAEQEGAGL